MSTCPLQRSQIIRVSKFGPELLKEIPVTLLAISAKGISHMAPQIGFDPIVVEQERYVVWM